MTEFPSGYLPEDWGEVMCIELLCGMAGSDPLEFLFKVQAKNALPSQHTVPLMKTSSVNPNRIQHES